MSLTSAMFVALAALSLPISARQEASEELFENVELEGNGRGWRLNGARVVDGAGPGGDRAVVLSPPSDGTQWTHFGIGVDDLPVNRELLFSVSVQAKRGSMVMINSFAYDAAKKKLDQWSERILTVSEDWTDLTQTYVLPVGTKQLTMFVISSNQSDVLLARPSLKAGERSLPKDLSGPGILRANASTSVRASEPGAVGHVLFPVPLPTEHQVPLTFEVTTEPASALRGFRWIPRDDGVNWLCEVEVAPEGDGTLVRWESLVLVRDREDEELPASSKARTPKEAKAWLRSTACIQSDDEGIVAKAKELASDDIATYVGNVLGFTSTNKGVGEPFTALDAKTALGCGGSCTSRANLAAALFRAGGIPARTAAHLPTWSGPLYEHWHVEYWHPGAGWTWVEPTLGKLRPKPYSMVVLNVANPDDEDAGFDPVIAHSGVMTGVPRYAVHEHSKELQLATPEWRLENYQLNEARAAGSIDSDEIDAIFKRAERGWKSLIKKCEAGELDTSRTARIEEALAEEETTAAVYKALKP